MRKGIEIAFKSVEYRSSLRSNKKNLSRQSNNLTGLGIAKVRTFLMSRMTTSLTIKRDLIACRTRQAAPGHSLAHSDSGNSLVSNRPLSTLIPAPKFCVNYRFYIQSQTRLNDYMDSQKTRILGLIQYFTRPWKQRTVFPFLQHAIFRAPSPETRVNGRLKNLANMVVKNKQKTTFHVLYSCIPWT